MDGPDELDWRVRHAVYAFLAAEARPPSVAETAAALGIDAERARLAYERLHQRHAFFLEPGTHTIRMANPFSGIPTSFRVHANGRSYFANCAWDALGVPAALGADARIEAVYAEDGAAATLWVEGDALRGDGGLIHFLRPVARWYDNLIET